MVQTNPQSEEEPQFDHWKDEWDYRASKTVSAFETLSETELLQRVAEDRIDAFFTLWDVIGGKATPEAALPVLWTYLQKHAGEPYELSRYHCAAALFQLLGMPDPECDNELRKRAQWNLDGEKERQQALRELKQLIQTTVPNAHWS